MADKNESRHTRFLRLMQKRLGRALEELRLVSQLSSHNYQYKPEEAHEVMLHLDGAMREIATAFNVPYSSAVGRVTSLPRRVGPIDEVDLAKAIDFIVRNQNDKALEILRASLAPKQRRGAA